MSCDKGALSALDADSASRKMRLPTKSIPPGARFFDVANARSHQDPVACVDRHHHHGPAQEGTAKRLDARLAAAEARIAAAGRSRLHPALRAGARRPGDARILVVANLH